MNENAATDAGSGEVVGAEKHCYICWEAANENGKGELHRDCACRGDNGHCHLPCLITAKKASNNALEPLTRSWLKCNQCQDLYADPTKRELIRAMNGGQSLAKRLLSTFINLLWRLPWLIWHYTVLTLYGTLMVTIYLFIGASIILMFPSAKRLYRTSAVETRLTCAVVILFIIWKYRHGVVQRIKLLGRLIVHRIGREVYFNFWFAAEGIGANGLSVALKSCAFAALALLGYLRIRQRGTFDYPFHARPRVDRTESRFRKASRFVSFYAREVGFWALFDAYYTAYALLFLAGWAAYIWTVASALQYLTERLSGEPDYLEQLFEKLTLAVTPWIKRVWEESVVFDDFKNELENYQSEIARDALDEDLITVGQYIEVDPAVKRVMDDTRENNFWWCCL